jgi:demethoxyubiquinone hydroxylase (CLK1/Coq7/Cat5 family)
MARADSLGGRILKVNHAGENGAIHIYTGQILMARWTAPGMHEEQQHHDRSAAQVPPNRFWLRALFPIVSSSTEAVIWLGMRL